MPAYDGKGPEGRGPNGRGLGPCGQGNFEPRRRFLRFGWRRGGRGRGFLGFNRPVVDEKEDLQAEKSWLKGQLEAIEKRLTELKEN